MSTMQSSTSSSNCLGQQFIPLLPDAHNRARQHSAPSSTSLNASIWAPQPQSPGGTWPKDVLEFDEHSGSADNRLETAQRRVFPIADDRSFTKEDVFGLPSTIQVPTQARVGAIGEGRQRDLPFREAEVCKLLSGSVLYTKGAYMYAFLWSLI